MSNQIQSDGQPHLWYNLETFLQSNKEAHSLAKPALIRNGLYPEFENAPPPKTIPAGLKDRLSKRRRFLHAQKPTGSSNGICAIPKRTDDEPRSLGLDSNAGHSSVHAPGASQKDTEKILSSIASINRTTEWSKDAEAAFREIFVQPSTLLLSVAKDSQLTISNANETVLAELVKSIACIPDKNGNLSADSEISNENRLLFFTMLVQNKWFYDNDLLPRTLQDSILEVSNKDPKIVVNGLLLGLFEKQNEIGKYCNPTLSFISRILKDSKSPKLRTFAFRALCSSIKPAIRDREWPQSQITIMNTLFSLQLPIDEDDAEIIASLFVAAAGFNRNSKKFAMLMLLVINKHGSKLKTEHLDLLQEESQKLTTFLKKSIGVAINKAKAKVATS